MTRILWRVIAMAAVASVVFILYRLLTINPPETTPFLESPRPLNLAHRGGAALGPENTLIAFRNALAMGADGLDLDVRASRDGQLVVIYDETVDRTTDGSGKVSEMTWEELQRLDAGYNYTPDNGVSFPYRGKGVKIPALREVLEAFPETRLLIEIRQADPPIEEALAALIREMNAQDRVLVVANEEEVVRRFRHAAPEVATGATPAEWRRFYLLQRIRLGAIYRPVAGALWVPQQAGGSTIVTQGFIRAAHAQGMRVYVWTVNTPDRMRQLLQWGVDGIITDRPDLLRQVMAEVGF